MRPLAALLTLFAGACCSSLPRVPAKRVALPPLRAAHDDVRALREEWRDARRERDVPVAIYRPAAAGARLPVVVFSHGIGENRDSYAWLGRELARHGFLAVHVTHAGTDRAVLERGYRHLYRAVKQKENWVNRVMDVPFVLDQVARRSDADMDRVAVAGHSAGAFTAFAVAGLGLVDGNATRDPRVKAIVAMSMPRMDGVVAPGGYDVAAPVLNLTGTCDISPIYRTWPRHRRIPFDAARAPRQYLVTLEKATHVSFVVEDRHRDAVAAIMVAFLRAWLLEDAASRAWFDDPGLADAFGSRVFVERKSESAR